MVSKYSLGSYTYLESEDAAFALCFRLTEDQFLEMAGGLKRYVQHKLDRAQARGATMIALNGETVTFDVPRLPDNTEEAMSQIQVPGTKEDEFAKYLLQAQVTKVEGIMGALRANRQFKDMAEREATEKANQRAYEIEKLASQNPYGWAASSQSAKDWSEAEFTRRQRRY